MVNIKNLLNIEIAQSSKTISPPGPARQLRSPKLKTEKNRKKYKEMNTIPYFATYEI